MATATATATATAGAAVAEFIEWVQDLECGIDLTTQDD